MKVTWSEIKGLAVIEPAVFGDSRGYFFESYSQRDFDREVAVPATGKPVVFVQDNESKSTYGVVRGLHFQRPPYTQSKLVRCVRGRVLDVALDLRTGSPTYGRHLCVELSEDNHRQLFIPRGFAHGFSVLSESAVFQYKCDEFYHPEADDGILLTDGDLGIDWKIPVGDMVLSEKDKARMCLCDRKENIFSDNLYQNLF